MSDPNPTTTPTPLEKKTPLETTSPVSANSSQTVLDSGADDQPAGEPTTLVVAFAENDPENPHNWSQVCLHFLTLLLSVPPTNRESDQENAHRRRHDYGLHQLWLWLRPLLQPLTSPCTRLQLPLSGSTNHSSDLHVPNRFCLRSPHLRSPVGNLRPSSHPGHWFRIVLSRYLGLRAGE